MHIIYTLTRMPVSVVIKALKLEGLWEYRHGYTESVCRVFNPGCSVHLSLTSNVTTHTACL